MDWADGLAAPLTGLVGGVMLGLAARRGRFCTLGAIEDALYGQNWDRIRMWGVALGVAIIGTYLLHGFGPLDLDDTLYARYEWNPAASVIGGLIFGYGMAIAGNCGYGALARLGGGDLRSLVIVLMTGIAAYATTAGPLAGVRMALFPPAQSDTGVDGIAQALAAPVGVPSLLPALAIGAGLLLAALWAGDFRRSASQVFWAGVVGAAVVLGWWGTSWAAVTSFQIVPTQSHSFTAPLGETVLYAMTGGTPGFAIASVAGVVLGAVIGSISKGHFRWEACDDPQELGRQILGGVLMGIGGVLALGCSVGQGLTAFSTLAFSAPVVLASVFAGSALGLRQLIHGFSPT